MSARPIIAGYYPDPSICRVDNTYYIVNSSFEYTPGVPLHRSTDLTTWEPVTNILARPSQLNVSFAPPSTGIYAATVRHHDGRFWMVTTNVLEGQRGQLIVSSEHAEGPWSEPVYVAGTTGIDPDLFWDEEEVCHLTWASTEPSAPGIASAPVDPVAGVLLDAPRLLWQGTGLAFPEAPHLYRRDGWWYVLLAEGGTERGHTVTIARSRSLDEPFEAAPGNPILSHRSTSHPVQNTGHADLVELADGSWAMVYLAVRPRGRTPMFHTNGRETFIAGIDWVDGWPVVDEDRFVASPPDHSFRDRFDTEPLDQRWISPNVWAEDFVQHAEGGGLVLSAPAPNARRQMLLSRARDEQWRATATLDVSDGSARLLVRIDDAHWCGLLADERGIEATLTIGPAIMSLGRMDRPAGPVQLVITARTPEPTFPMPRNEPDIVELGVAREDGTVEVLASVDGRYFSTEVAGGFTGRTVGVEPVSGSVTVREISYQPISDGPVES
ncbi:glycoside hydrolase family 43 protein [Brachybacterium massiliense]|uniref:glycoside hydrolase family 43 protein n=1 Tax=Brachybacterium massiliense TaxID=1755098 RepID=UPI000B3BB0EC|nr:glycoside hydrolase family 43 protein [Brachybacterium massiliense]